MTGATFYENIYDTIDLIINTTLSKSITIRQENQNAQRPTSKYIVIGNPISRKKVGLSVKSGTTSNTGISQIISTYEVSLPIREIMGDGELLQDILNYMESNKVQEFMRSKSIVFFRSENITPIPDIGEGWIENRASVVMFFGYAHEILVDTSYISNVELENNIIE